MCDNYPRSTLFYFHEGCLSYTLRRAKFLIYYRLNSSLSEIQADIQLLASQQNQIQHHQMHQQFQQLQSLSQQHIQVRLHKKSLPQN